MLKTIITSLMLTVAFPAFGAARVGAPVTQAVPYTAPTGIPQPKKDKPKHFFEREITNAVAVFGLLYNDNVKECSIQIADPTNDKNFTKIIADLTNGEVYVIIQNSDWNFAAQPKKIKTYIALFGGPNAQGYPDSSATVVNPIQILIPNIKIEIFTEMLLSKRIEVSIAIGEAIYFAIDPKIPEAFKECLKEAPAQ